MSQLVETTRRPRELFESKERVRAEGLEEVSRAIGRRFGGAAITRAVLLEGDADDDSNDPTT